MGQANRLQAQANAISSAFLARQTVQEAPFLIATHGSATGTKDGPASADLLVQNRGGSLAHEIIIDTAWGELQIASLAPGDPPQTRMVTFEGPWDTNARPEIRQFRFKGANGVQWVQVPNQIPERADPPQEVT